MTLLKVLLIIPTYNAETNISILFSAIQKQTLQPSDIFIVDSSSTDRTTEELKKLNVSPLVIKPADFDHGGTRQLAIDLNPDYDIYLFLTQDAIPASPDAFEKVIQPFIDNQRIGCVYGRQLPAPNATPLAAHARQFNYPANSQLKSYTDKKRLGIKTCFSSDSFAAYRKIALQEVGGFPSPIPSGEDLVVAARLLKANWCIYYQAEAAVYHSHNLSLRDEFQRYFDTGMMHKQYRWILDEFASPNSEGWRYARSEIKYLWHKKQHKELFHSFFSIASKFIGYQLGKHYLLLPHFLVQQCSKNKSGYQKKTNQQNE